MDSSIDDSEWEKSTSEIQSEDSEDLFESRPNRWRGPPQSWRTLTEEDRLTFTALQRLRNQDLSVHLYNAFALKKAPNSHGYQDADTNFQPQGHSQLEPWTPPKSWTAWPLRVDLIPPDDLMKRTEDKDEVLTFRKLENKAPSSQLEEVVSAAILRFAKEKFRKRQLNELPASAHDNNSVNTKHFHSGRQSNTNPSGSESESGSEEEEKGKVLNTKTQQARGKSAEKTYRPAVTTDDDASYELIRPSTRAILTRLDHTLTILHRARNTSYRGAIDSASSSSDAEDDLYNEATTSGRRSRSRANSRSRPTSRSASVVSSRQARSRSLSRGATASPSKPRSNRGRKGVSVPREGESEREFLVRRAKEQKKRRPVFSDDETTAAAEDTKSTRKSSPRRTRASSGDGAYWSQKKLDRLNLRGWSDVMGAAALAGFDGRVIERATQRCASLFGQGMEMRTINEDVGMETKRYIPGRVTVPSESEDEHEVEETDGHERSSLSRPSSLAMSRPISLASSDAEGLEYERRRVESPRKRQKRSSSRGSALDSYYCHHAGCERALRSFDRPGNLRRHLKLVHGEDDGQADHAPQPGSNDMYYCTHADCERATRPFEKRHNLRRHLHLVHGQGSGGSTAAVPKVATAQYFCPHNDCDRAARPFDRRTNLKRHLLLVHGEGDSRRQRQSEQTDHGENSTGKSRWKESSDEGESESEDDSSTESGSHSQSE